MATARPSRTAQEVALIQAQLQFLADNPGRVQRLRGTNELAGLRHQPRDSRRPTDPRSPKRYVADNGTYWQDQSANYAAGLL